MSRIKVELLASEAVASMQHRGIDSFDALHPALPGHFPGNAIVPGVLILARVLNAAAVKWDSEIRNIAVAKFHARLLPGEEFTIELERAHDDARFRVMRGETLIAGGTLKLGKRIAPAP